MKNETIVVENVDIKLLKKQRNFLLKQKSCDETEGLINLLDYMLDKVEQ